MQNHLHELLIDLKAAASIGHPESLQAALDRIRDLPDENVPPHELVPLGAALSRLPTQNLLPLLDDPDPAIRVVASAALGSRYSLGLEVSPHDLHKPAGDPNPEVRNALAKSLTNPVYKSVQFEQLFPLIKNWLASPSEHLVYTGLRVLSAVQPSTDELKGLLGSLNHLNDHEARAALVNCLNNLAENGEAGVVLVLLETWSGEPEPNTWVITRALSASWARRHSPQAVDILKKLAGRVGKIRSVRRALERHAA